MKRFFYLSGSLFFLSLTLFVGIQIGNNSAGASPSDPREKDIVGFWLTGGNIYLMLQDGAIYKRDYDGKSFVDFYPVEFAGAFWADYKPPEEGKSK